MGLQTQLLRMGSGSLQPQQRDISGLVVGRILARRLAQGGRVRHHIQNIVDHLECHAQGLAVFSQRIQRLCLGPGVAGSPHQHAAQQQGTGLQAVHLAQLRFRQLLAHAGQVNGLTTGHALAACSGAQQTAQPGLHGARDFFAFRQQQLESQGLQGIARQQGRGFSELHMHGGLATAQHIVVHAGHVVMHQRIGMDQLDRATGAQRGRALAAHGFGSCPDQQRAQALAAVEYGVAHGFAQTGGRTNAHPARQCLLGARQALCHPGGKIQGCRAHVQRRLLFGNH